MEDSIEIIEEVSAAGAVEDDRKVIRELPGKLNDCSGTVLFYNSSMKAGIIKTHSNTDSIYCMFNHESLLISEDDLKVENLNVLCDAWMMRETAYVPYMAAVVWTEESPPSSQQKQKILGNPNSTNMDAYSEDADKLTRILKDERGKSKDRDDRKTHKKHKKEKKKRSRSRERRRSRSGDRHRSSERDDRHRGERKKHKRDDSRDRHRKKDRKFREESPERSHRSRSPDHHENGRGEYNSYRGRGGYRGRMRGRVRILRGAIPAPAAAGKPKLAIGRNVFQASDEEAEAGTSVPAPAIPLAIRGRGRGRFIRIGRGALPGLKLKKLVHGEEIPETIISNEERPGLGYADGVGPSRTFKESSRWKRWQKLSRTQEEEAKSARENNGEPRDTSPVSVESEKDEYGGDAEVVLSKTSRRSISTRSKSPVSSGANGLRVSVMTYETEEVGILSGPKETKVLFHINQVWIKHPSAGFCPFTEIYPIGDLSKHFYPGREISCHMRVIPKTRDVKAQAEAVWLQGFPPEESVYKTRELPAELNFHLAQYNSGKCGKLELVLSVDQHSSLNGTIQEYISYELGLIRLVGQNGGVVLFHLDQVWIYEGGSWVLFKDVMNSPISIDYLPIGSSVSVSVRKLPCSANSHLRYQGMVVWNKEVCKQREAADSSAESWGSFNRRALGLEEGKVPPGYIRMYSLPENHAKLIRTLDTHFDNFKKLLKLEMKNINGVPVLLNMLPPDWEAKVYRVIDDDNGVIVIKHKKNYNMSYDDRLKITKMFAIFHVEDVFTNTGEKFRKSPAEFMLQLHGLEVDLTARSIVGEGANEGVLTSASQLNLSIMNPNVACPVLQAITVFIKPAPESNPNTRLASKPTFLRSYPDSFHLDDPGTAFFLDARLMTKLDLKALNFFNATSQAKMQKEVINGLPMAYFHQTKKSISTDKHEQIKLMAEMENIDTNKTCKLIYGSYRELPKPPIQPQYPNSLHNVTCSPRILYQQGMYAKEGVVLCEIPTAGGHRIAVYAFFDISNYKFSLQKELRVKDFADIIPIYMSPNLRANIILINPNNPIPYVATAVWNPAFWSRAPDLNHKLDDLYLQKYERMTAGITSRAAPTLANPNLPLPVLYGQGPPPGRALPPSVAVARPQAPPKLYWSRKELLREVVGRVTSIIDENYGLAVVKFASPVPPYDRHRAIVLFDTCDLWLGEHTATELGTNLSGCMREGDYIKVKALLVPESENDKNIRYLATGVVTGRTKNEVRNMPLPEQDRLENIDKIHPDKLNNFYQVVSVVCANLPGVAEDEVEGVSTDEETLPKSFDISEGSDFRRPTDTDRHFSRNSMMSMDAFEEERETKKNAKALECQNNRRKMGYSKEARDKLLGEMKLPNQLMWKCVDCQISCAKPGMEKHITLKTHWDKVFENYCKKLDGMRQAPVY